MHILDIPGKDSRGRKDKNEKIRIGNSLFLFMSDNELIVAGVIPAR